MMIGLRVIRFVDRLDGARVRVLRWLGLRVALLLLLTVPLAAQWTYVKTAAEVTVSSTAVDLFVEADVVAGDGHVQATVATCTLTAANIRISFSGVAPTTSLGQILTPGQYTITGSDVMKNLQGIRDDSTDATWNCVISGQ